jgi:hypothetical protein
LIIVFLNMKNFNIKVNKTFDKLPDRYKNHILKRYKETAYYTKNKIKKGKLSTAYSFPNFSTFADCFLSLESYYESFLQNGWHPEIVFILKYLSTEEWNELLSGYSLKGNRSTEGIYKIPSADNQNNVKSPLWGVGIVSATQRPLILGISKDGTSESNKTGAINSLFNFHHVVNKMPAKTIIKKVCPSEELYFSLQLSLFERGKEPVDKDTFTLGKEDEKDNRIMMSRGFDYCGAFRKTGSILVRQNFFSKYGGIRPSIETNV